MFAHAFSALKGLFAHAFSALKGLFLHAFSALKGLFANAVSASMCNLYRLVISHVGPPTYDLETFHEEQTLEARADLKFHYVAKSDNEIASANCP